MSDFVRCKNVMHLGGLWCNLVSTIASPFDRINEKSIWILNNNSFWKLFYIWRKNSEVIRLTQICVFFIHYFRNLSSGAPNLKWWKFRRKTGSEQTNCRQMKILYVYFLYFDVTSLAISNSLVVFSSILHQFLMAFTIKKWFGPDVRHFYLFTNIFHRLINKISIL